MEKDYDRKRTHLYDLNREWLKKENTLKNDIDVLIKKGAVIDM